MYAQDILTTKYNFNIVNILPASAGMSFHLHHKTIKKQCLLSLKNKDAVQCNHKLFSASDIFTTKTNSVHSFITQKAKISIKLAYSREKRIDF